MISIGSGNLGFGSKQDEHPIGIMLEFLRCFWMLNINLFETLKKILKYFAYFEFLCIFWLATI